jgi:hypothetical protein
MDTRSSQGRVDNITTALGIAAEAIAATLSPAYVGVAARPFGLTMRGVIEPETIRHVSLYRPSQRSMQNPSVSSWSIGCHAGAPAQRVRPLGARNEGTSGQVLVIPRLTPGPADTQAEGVSLVSSYL